MKAEEQGSTATKIKISPILKKGAALKKGAKKAKVSATSTGSKRTRQSNKLSTSISEDLIGYGKSTLAHIPKLTKQARARISKVNLQWPNRDVLRNVVAGKPAMAGAIGLGLGAVIGMMLPHFGKSTVRAKPVSRRKK
jgi:hypothetical protein